MAGVAITILLLCLVVLSTMSVSAVKWMGKKRRKTVSGNIVLEDNVVDIVDPTDIEIKSSEIELIDPEFTSGANIRKERREERKNIVSVNKEIMPIMPEISISAPNENIAQMPNMNRTVICSKCTSRFEVSMNLKTIKCPICEFRIDL